MTSIIEVPDSYRSVHRVCRKCRDGFWLFAGLRAKISDYDLDWTCSRCKTMDGVLAKIRPAADADHEAGSHGR